MCLVIHTEFKGILAEWVGALRRDFSLPAPARYSDLLKAIGEALAPNMPTGLWDPDSVGFKPAVMADIDGRSIHAPEEPLHHGDVIRFMLLATGG